jgi:hypothetical protein
LPPDGASDARHDADMNENHSPDDIVQRNEDGSFTKETLKRAMKALKTMNRASATTP